MRFSLKWILAGMAYVAVAAAAFSQKTWAYADVLWIVSVLTFMYVAKLAIYSRGKRRACQLGFIVGSVCFLLCLHFGGDSVPTSRLIKAAGLYELTPPSGSIYPGDPTPVPMAADGIVDSSVLDDPFGGTLQVQPPARDYEIISARYRAANAVATLAFGLMGWLVGLIAYRAAVRDAATVN